MSRQQSLLILVLVTVSSVRSQFNCPSQGMFADPANCQNFIHCSYQSQDVIGPNYFTCGVEQLFNDIYLVCDHDYAVDCGSRPLPGGGTQTPPPPTTPGPPTTTTTTLPGQTTTTRTTTTTTRGPQPPMRYPDKVLGMYLTLADDTEEGFGSDADWDPRLYPYQLDGANVLFFSFIHPGYMTVPLAFQKLAATRGTGADGAVPEGTVIMFAIGGYAYSQNPNPWPFLLSQSAAESMAEEVATWPDRYGCDGIDMDIEEGAGFHPDAGPNLVHFMRRLRDLKPDIIIGQPTYGYPQVDAANVVINNSWRPGGSSQNLADSIGIMVYEGTQSLDYVDRFAHGSTQYEGYPITVDVPYQGILIGCKGQTSAADIGRMADESMRQDLLGIMVWYASVRNGFQYAEGWDASTDTQAQGAYVAAMQLFNS